MVDGHRVVQGVAVCRLSQPGPCGQVFGIPDIDAYFLVEVWSHKGGVAAIREIRDSLTVLGP
jgi:hypothetical protein